MSDRISGDKHRLWLAQAERGHPPSVVRVAQTQYQLDAPWWVRKHIWGEVQGLGSWPEKRRRARMAARGHGKSIAATIAVLYASEYLLPYLDIHRSNRLVNVVGRSEKYVMRKNMDYLEDFICYHAPWLKTRDKALWDEPEALKQWKLKSRSWGQTRKDLTNGISIRAYGFNQSVRGDHLYLTIIDDPIDEDNAHHGLEHYDKIDSAIMKSTRNGGLCLLFGTPIHDNDVWTYVKEDGERWDYREFPAYDRNGDRGYKARNEADVEAGYLPKDAITQSEDWHCLWPKQMNYVALESERGDTRRTELNWLRELLLERVADVHLLVHPEDFNAALHHDQHYYANLDPDLPHATFCGVDPSTLVRSNFVAWVGTKTDDGHIRPLYREMIRAKDHESQEAREARMMSYRDRLLGIHRRFRPKKYVIEGTAFQNFLKPVLEEHDDVFLNRVETVSLTSNKHLDDGWPLIRTRFEAGLIDLPYGPTPDEDLRVDRGELAPGNYVARKVTDELRYELDGVYYMEGGTVETTRNRPNDQVAAFYFMLRAGEDIGPSPSVEGFALEPSDGDVDGFDLDVTDLFDDPERNPRSRGKGRDDAMRRVARARDLERR